MKHKISEIKSLLHLGLPSVLAFFVVWGVSQFAITTERGRMAQDLKNHVAHEAAALSTALEAELNATVFLANGMIPVISVLVDPDDAIFAQALESLHRYGRHVRNIGVAPGNRLAHVYPREGNEAVIGLYYPDIPAQWPAVKRAIETRKTVLSGPVVLRQGGGDGLIVRTPVFLEGDSFWGVVSLVLDVRSLFADVGLMPVRAGVRFALRGRDGSGADGPVFFGATEVFADDPVTQILTVPGGRWQLAAVPVAGWQAGQGYLAVMEVAAVLLALLLARIIFAYQDGQRRLAVSERRVRAIMETTGDSLIVIDESGMIDEFNPAAQRLFGYDRSEMIGASVNRLMLRKDAAEHDRFIKTFRLDMVRNMSRGRQIIGVRKDGSTFPAEISIGDMVLGQRRLHVGAVRDITERKAFELKLVEMASIDPLTGTLNRRAFLEEGSIRLDLAKRHGRPLCMLMVDADHFKAVNDTYGHHVGDAVLVRLADVTRKCLRESDRLGRMGGEEFAVLLPETDLDDARRVADRILMAVRGIRVPVEGAAQEVRASGSVSVSIAVSIGMSCFKGGDASLDTLMQAADVALYRAKTEGRDRVCAVGARAPSA